MAEITRPDDPFEAPDDFGQALIDEFERRSAEPSILPSVSTDSVSTDTTDAVDADDSTDTTSSDSPAADLSSEGATGPAEVPDASTSAAGDMGSGDTGFVHSGVPTDPEAPTADAATDPDSDTSASTADDTADSTSAPEPYPGYIWVEGDQRVEFSEAQVREGLALSAWAKDLPQPTRDAFNAIESGTHRAVPIQEYEAFANWRASQAAQAPQPDDIFADPYEAELARLRAEVAQLRGTTAAPADPAAQAPSATGLAAVAPDQYAQSAFTHRTDQTLDIMERSARAYGEARGLSEDQVNTLVAEAVQLNIIPAIADAAVTRNPVTGQVVAQGDPAKIMETALDVALVRNKDLAAAVRQPHPDGIPQTTPSTDQLSAPLATEAEDALAAKKARAASVASAPASSTRPSTPRVSEMSPQDITEAIAKELAATLAG